MYRDSFDKCPRCAIELADAGSARRCTGCGGLFVEEAILSEMIVEMVPPGPLTRLQLAILEREEPALPCPSCGEPMQQSTIHHVPIDRCGKGHGAWFDRDELETALRRTGELGAAGMLEVLPASEPRAMPRPITPPIPSPPIPTPPVEPPTPAPIDPRTPLQIPTTAHRSIAITVEAPGQPPITSQLLRDVIKIGRQPSAHVVLPHGDVNRLHAVIESEEHRVVVIDLGSTTGTYVNDQPVGGLKELRSGDRIRIGPYTLVVAFA